MKQQPVVLELGGGTDCVEGAINADIADVPEKDIHMDMTAAWPFRDSSIDRIEAHQSLEHVPDTDLPFVFVEGYRVLKSGGEFVVDVPLAYSDDMANDPTHLSKSWWWRTPKYFTGSDPLSFETESEYGLESRQIRLYLTSGRWFARPLSWLLKQLSIRNPSLIDLVKLPYVTGQLEFVLRKP